MIQYIEKGLGMFDALNNQGYDLYMLSNRWVLKKLSNESITEDDVNFVNDFIENYSVVKTKEEILQRLIEIDLEKVRPISSILLSQHLGHPPSEWNIFKLDNLEAEAVILREELIIINSKEVLNNE